MGSKKTFYYLDDSKELLDAFSHMAADFGHECFTFSDPFGFIEEFKQKQLKSGVLLIDLDFKIPHLDGINVIEALEENNFCNFDIVYLFTGQIMTPSLRVRLNQFNSNRVQYLLKNSESFVKLLEISHQNANSYILEHSSENDRLEYQAQQRNYDPTSDFTEEELTFDNGMTILDAGCGSGVLSRLIAMRNVNKDINIYAVDSSEARIKDAIKRSQDENLSSIKFKAGNLTNLDFADESIDVIISRFVYEHNPNKFKEITEEAYRVLKKGGIYYVIDSDGILANMGSKNQEFLKLKGDLLDGLQHIFEPYPCRKLPSFLATAGFNFSTPQLVPMIFFEKHDLEYEDHLWRMRFDSFNTLMQKIIGERTDWFKEQFFKELWSTEHLFYYTRFIFRAYK